MRRYFGLFIAFSLTGLARAEGQPVALDWQDCVAIAAKNNPDLLAALQTMESSRARYKGSFNGILPQLSLSNSYNESSRSSVNRVTGAVTDSRLYSAQGVLSLDLVDFSQWSAIESSLASYRQNQATLRLTSSETLLSLYQAFTGLLYAQEAIGVDTTIRNTWKVNAQMVQLRYQSGRESKGNMMNTQAQLLQSEAALEQDLRDLRVEQQRLNQALGKETFTLLVVTGTWTASQVPSAIPDFERLLETHPRIQSQQSAVAIANAAIHTARSPLLPTLSLNYAKGVQGRTELPNDPFWTFTGTLNYPLFAGGPTATYYASRASVRDYERARQDLRATWLQVRTDLESAWAAFAEARDQVEVQRAFLAAARQRNEESDVRYQNGLMSFEDWIRVVTDYASTQTNFLKSRQNLILAEAQWRFAQGEQL